MEYYLRRASKSDKSFLYSLHCTTMGDVIEKTWGWNDAWQRDEFERRFKEHHISIIEIKGRDVGALWLRSSADLIYIADFQVLPELQGHGIGTSVLKGLLTQASTNDIPVELAVLQVNPRARRLYERHGFKVIDEGDPFIRMRYDHHIRMIDK